jgi:hypothetical protein
MRSVEFLGLLGGLLSIACDLLAIQVIRAITQRQDALLSGGIGPAPGA